MTNFHEVRFPEDIAYGSSGGPEYSTDVIITHGGNEKRNINWEEARCRYNVAYGVQTQTQLDTLIAFFRARKGRAYGFRLKDWADYQMSGQAIGTGDGTTTSFQLQKIYASGGVNETRLITKPVTGTVAVYVDDVAQAGGWSVDTTTGIITFDSAPLMDEVITADCAFDVPVRFDTDQLSATISDYGSYGLNEVTLIELR